MSPSPLFTPSIKLINSLAWCLPTGFNTPITYFYLGFVVLLLHRQMRDDEACREKYGKDWDKYCKLVPYKIIPYVVSWLVSWLEIMLIVQY
jgi:protein-S-isoprenylcysteine O-methyltransferase Ste14